MGGILKLRGDKKKGCWGERAGREEGEREEWKGGKDRERDE